MQFLVLLQSHWIDLFYCNQTKTKQNRKHQLNARSTINCTLLNSKGKAESGIKLIRNNENLQFYHQSNKLWCCNSSSRRYVYLLRLRAVWRWRCTARLLLLLHMIKSLLQASSSPVPRAPQSYHYCKTAVTVTKLERRKRWTLQGPIQSPNVIVSEYSSDF